MKILITGCTATQINSKHRKHDLVHIPRMLESAIKQVEPKTDITWRAVIPGEDISRYDRVIVWMASISSLGSRFWFGAVWCLSQRPDAFVFVDDWQVHNIQGGIEGYIKDFDKCAFRLENRAYPEEAMKYKTPLLKCLQSFAKEWPTSVFPMYPWHDIDALQLPLKKAYALDYSPLVIPFKGTPASKDDRKKMWVLATLSDQSKWIKKLGLTWPLKCHGHSNLQAVNTGGNADQPSFFQQEGNPVVNTVSEETVYRDYLSCWGSLSPKYYHAKSGWWRIRWNYAAQSKSIMVGDPDETAKMSAAHQVQPKDVENMSVTELNKVAADQQTWMSDNTSSIRDVRKKVRRILDL